MNSFPVPSVLECMHFVLESSRENRRIIRNYELDLYLDGERDVFIDGVPYKLKKGSLVFRKPGQLTTGFGDYDMYMITLDFSHTVDKSQHSFRVSDAPEQPRCELDILSEIPTVFTPTHQTELIEIYEKLAQCSYPSAVDEDLQRAYVQELLFLILADAYASKRRSLEERGVGKSYIKRACAYINLNYSSELTVEGIAEYLSINQNYFIKLFRREMGTTPNQYVIDVRLLRAASMLMQTDHTVYQISAACGFNTPSYFIKIFKKRFGKTPNEYRGKSGI